MCTQLGAGSTTHHMTPSSWHKGESATWQDIVHGLNTVNPSRQYAHKKTKFCFLLKFTDSISVKRKTTQNM